MNLRPLPLAGAYAIEPAPRGDPRGSFARLFDAEIFAAAGLGAAWVQMNRSVTTKTGTVRGLHYQVGAHAEAKLIRCVAGRVWDVIVDLRRDAPTFGTWHAEELSAENARQIYVPEGFAHGFQTLSDNAELAYCHTAAYSPDHQGGVHPTDPVLAVAWPRPITLMSERDAALPALAPIPQEVP